MQRVLDIAHALFLETGMPPLPLLVPKPGESPPLPQLATLTGKERKAVFRACGLDQAHDLILLRALQHLTSLHSTEWLELDEYAVHGHLSANHWGPAGDVRQPLFGHPLCMSTEPRYEAPPPDSPQQPSTATHGCVGLLNQGSTCYLNSLLQALFHLTEFRIVIYRMPTFGDASDTKSIPFALQRLFCLLQTSSTALSTKHLTTSFGWSSHESFVQHDIHELTRILLDNLEEKLVKSGMDNAIKRLFCGVQQNYINVPDAEYCGVKDEPFYDLQLVVKDTPDIYKSFDALVQPEVLDGKNKYCLERDGAKSYHRAEKGIRFIQFPPVMILHLARFDFDPVKGDMCKIFSRWDYYESLNLGRYLPKGTPPDEGEYQLHSVLVHSGSDAKFGHYFCFVKVGTTWLKFNDEMVSEAEACDVFGANFGGSKLNYWGSETFLSTNAYMLVYLRKSLLVTLLRQTGPDELPPHLVNHIHKEKEEEARREREKAEDHLFARIHLVTAEDCTENMSILHQHCPRIKYDPKRTLRVYLSDNALASCAPAIEELLGIAAGDQMLWFSEARVSDPSIFRVQSRVTSETQVKTMCRDGEYSSFKECCLLVLDSKAVTQFGNPHDQPVLLTHHKLYDPHNLKVSYAGPIVIYGNVGHIRDVQTAFCKLLPEASRPADVKTAQYFVDLEEGASFTSAVTPTSGDIFVWQEQLSPQALQDVLYPSIEHFQHFLKNRIPVELHTIAPPFGLVLSTELSWDMSHAQVQKFVAKRVGEPNPDKVRFSRHNPETRQPFFAKIKRDVPNLRSMLTVNHELFRQLYFEVCPFTVQEIEQSNSLQFEYFADTVRCVSSHWILMPKSDGLTILEVLQRCLIDMRENVHATRSPSKDGESAEIAEALEAKDLRLVDVWKGRIYNVFDCENELTKGPFEESAEYRVERRPVPLPDVEPQRQLLVSIQHFSRGVGQINCHGDPFSLWVDVGWRYEELRGHINRKLNLSDQATIDWKPFLCRVNNLTELKLDTPLEDQLFQFADRNLYQPNQKDPKQMAFIGLEHSPLPHARRPPRREERSLRIYN